MKPMWLSGGVRQAARLRPRTGRGAARYAASDRNIAQSTEDRPYRAGRIVNARSVWDFSSVIAGRGNRALIEVRKIKRLPARFRSEAEQQRRGALRQSCTMIFSTAACGLPQVDGQGWVMRAAVAVRP